MNIKETYISLELAKLLEEKGIAVEVDTYYLIKDNISYEAVYDSLEAVIYINDTTPMLDYDKSLYRPTLALLQKYIREVYNVGIWVEIHGYTIKELRHIKPKYTYYINSNHNEERYSTYEEALEQGITKFIETLK